jgi:hypothetical protein
VQDGLLPLKQTVRHLLEPRKSFLNRRRGRTVAQSECGCDAACCSQSPMLRWLCEGDWGANRCFAHTGGVCSHVQPSPPCLVCLPPVAVQLRLGRRPARPTSARPYLSFSDPLLGTWHTGHLTPLQLARAVQAAGAAKAEGDSFASEFRARRFVVISMHFLADGSFFETESADGRPAHESYLATYRV